MVRDAFLFYKKDFPCLQPLYNFPETDDQQKKAPLIELYLYFLHDAIVLFKTIYICYVTSYLFQ